jgi:adenosylcobinamide kinase/adenosylcobinamide-phosphate guanylyltransferase
VTVTFILGGARSGKSAHAQSLAEAAPRPAGARLVMIVTAQATDDAEMVERIRRHRADRGPEWSTVEAPIDLSAAVDGLAPGDVAVVDCLTIWLGNLIHHDIQLEASFVSLLTALERAEADIFVVSNEVGLGIVPDNALARQFRDEAGRLHQRLAAQADRVVFVAAGLPLSLKA